MRDSLSSYGLSSTNVVLNHDIASQRLSEALVEVLSQNCDSFNDSMKTGYKSDTQSCESGYIEISGDSSTDMILQGCQYYVYDLSVWSRPYTAKSLKQALNKRLRAFKASYMPVIESTRKKRCTRLAKRVKI